MLLLRRTILFTRVLQRYVSTASSELPKPTSNPTSSSKPKPNVKKDPNPGPLQTWFKQFGHKLCTNSPPHQQFATLSKQQNWDEAVVSKNQETFLKAFKKQYTSHVDRYFFSYVDQSRFHYNPLLSPASQWRKLKEHMGWPKNEGALDRKLKEEKAKKEGRILKTEGKELDEETKKYLLDRNKLGAFLSARHHLRVAVGAEVGAVGQKKEEKEKRWGILCKILGVKPVPRTIGLCKEALVPFNVNIYDMLESIRIYERTAKVKRPTTFKTERVLGEYSVEKDRVFPLRMAHENEVLGLLLRHLFR